MSDTLAGVDSIPWTPEPWLPYLVTRYIGKLKLDSVFEWGSGGSTIFFHRMLVYKIISIEHDPGWYQRLSREFADRGILLDLNYRLIPFEEGEIGPDKGNPTHYKSGSTELGPVNFKNYASAIDGYGQFDLILIDGMARASCLAHAVSHVKEGGWLVLDNTGDRPYYLEQTAHLFEGWERITFFGYGPILDYEWETTIFRNTRKANYG
jgi:hypothetical protein